MSAKDLEPHLERLRTRIGLVGPVIRRKIEAGALIKFAHATGQTDPIFIDEEAARAGPYGALIAAPTYVSTFANDALVGLIVSDLPLNMFLHTDDAAENGEPIFAGDEITAIARVADVYVREGRNGPLLFQIAEMKLTNQRDEHVSTLRIGSVSFDVKETPANG